MTPFKARRYSPEQVDAFLRAVLVDKLPIAEAQRRAVAGTLRPGLGPFGKGSPRFGYTLLQKGRDSFEERNVEALETATTEALTRAHALNVRALRALGHDADPAERSKLAKAVAETDRARRSVPKRKGDDGGTATVGGDGSPPADPTLDALRELAARND